jgi:hypothetical protein
MFLLVVFFGSSALAQSPTITAASCKETDVNAVINGPTHTAAKGDTIQIPAGTCTWTSQLSITAGITLTGTGTPNELPSQMGSGTLNTTIIDNYASTSGPMINAKVPNGQMVHISTLLIQPNSSSAQLYSPIDVIGICGGGGCPNVRIDNIEFSGWNNSNGNQADWYMRFDNVYGVVDHITVPTGSGLSNSLANVHNSAWLGVGDYGDNSWAQPDNFGAASQLYFENLSMTNSVFDCDEGPSGGSQGGCRATVRFSQFLFGSNQSSNSITFTHGTESTGRTRGARQIEIYGNNATCNSSGGACVSAAVGMRSGVSLTFGNSFTGSFFDNIVSLVDYRTQAPRPSTYFQPWNNCDGTSGYDNNDGSGPTSTVYYTGTYTGPSGSKTFVDSNENWASTFGSSSWASNASANGNPYSIHNVTQSFGGEIGSTSGDNIIFFTPPGGSPNNPICNWATQAGCTWNTGDTYQILRASACLDQPSRSGGSLLSGKTPAAVWVGQVLDPTYEWMDTVSGSLGHGVVEGYTAKLINNRDFYMENKNQGAQTSQTSPFNGSSGTGHGTLANRPASCTTGVGYYATDQGDWNQSGNGFGQGQLFVCASSNNWQLDYTPLAYPHPLIAGGSGTTGGNPPPAPTNVTTTVQ